MNAPDADNHTDRSPLDQTDQGITALPIDDSLRRTGGAPDRPSEVPALALFTDRKRFDRWAHRRGEPRVFAFFWAMYLLVAIAMTVVVAPDSLPALIGAQHAPARDLLYLSSIGLTVLWPLTRLSQSPPDGHPLMSHFTDLLVVLLPLHTLAWPMHAFTSWGLSTVTAIALLLTAWGSLVSGVLAVTLTPCESAGCENRVRFDRAWTMLALLAASIGPALIAAVAPLPPLVTEFLSHLSPFSAIAHLTEAPFDAAPREPTGIAWSAIATVWSIGLASWLVAALTKTARCGMVPCERPT
ncbi:MAG: hypothetical protein JNM07_02360 [Phycisphaerae bacterium]|nr:hypothetical protein [Phycisphaerae bacterium]